MTASMDGGRNETGRGEHARSSSGKSAFVAGSDGERSDAELFQRVRARLRAAVGEDVFNSWFARLDLEEVVDEKAHLSVPTRFLCSWIQSNYAEKILDTFKTETARVQRLHFTVRVNGQARPRLTAPIELAPELEAEPSAPAAAKPQREMLAPRGDALSGSALDPK